MKIPVIEHRAYKTEYDKMASQMQAHLDSIEAEPIDEMQLNSHVSIGQLLRNLRDEHYEQHKITLTLLPAQNMIRVQIWQ